jgi:hypothetical protein
MLRTRAVRDTMEDKRKEKSVTLIQERTEKINRQDLIDALVARDGTRCQYPGDSHELDFSILDGPQEVTIDHWYPQHAGRSEGWTYEQIWDLSNLKLMCKKHNAKKGDLIPNEDGTLPERNVRKFRYRRDKRADRAEVCASCENGHNLGPDEVCASCGRDAQAFPRWAKVRYQDCDHELMWCWSCSIGVTPRTNSVGTAMRQADSDEIGEFFAE